jgi:ankyrin repeat protein
LFYRFTIIERGYSDILSLILSKYPDAVNRPCESEPITGHPPITIALLFHQYDCLKVLLTSPLIDINYQEKQSGLSPIMLAVIHHQPLLFQLLLARSPDISLLSFQRRSLLYMIIEHGQIDMMISLFETYPPSSSNTVNENEETINQRIDLNAFVDELNSYTAVHAAIVNLQKEILRLLLEYGASISCMTKDNLNVFQLCDLYQSNDCKVVLEIFYEELRNRP